MNVLLRQLSGLGAILTAGSLVGCTAVVEGPSNASSPMGGAGGSGPAPQACDKATGPAPAAAPLRRLTQFEYNNTLRDLAAAPPTQLPAEDKGNLFATDVAKQSVSPALVRAYHDSAKAVALTLTTETSRTPTVLAPCAVAPAVADEPSCARTVVEAFVPKAYRRPLVPGEADRLVQLFQTVRTSGQSFAASLAAVLEVVLQSPSFLYRQEVGVPIDGRQDIRRVSDTEMATRLSYLLWGSKPDDALLAAAAAGELHTPEQVKASATRLLADGKSRDVVRYFFDYLLPIQGLASLQRDDYPHFNSTIGAMMRTEVETFVEREVFGGSGTWPGILTAPYTYVNADLAAYYGFQVQGATSEFQQVPLDGVKRAGLLSLGGVAAGTVHSKLPNPVVRGAFVVKTLLCQIVPPPTGEVAKEAVPPAEDLAPTARERYALHRRRADCRACHINMDPIGLSLENLDAVGLWRDQENNVTIDASADSPLLGSFNGPVELGQRIAVSELAQECFAKRWVDYGYGRSTDNDNCSLVRVREQFKAANYNIQHLLLELTQTDDFLYFKVEP